MERAVAGVRRDPDIADRHIRIGGCFEAEVGILIIVEHYHSGVGAQVLIENLEACRGQLCLNARFVSARSDDHIAVIQLTFAAGFLGALGIRALRTLGKRALGKIIDIDTVHVIPLCARIAVAGSHLTEKAGAVAAVGLTGLAVVDCEHLAVFIRTDRTAGGGIIGNVHTHPAVLPLIGVDVGDPPLIVLDRPIDQVAGLVVGDPRVYREISHLGICLRSGSQHMIDDERYHIEPEGDSENDQREKACPSGDCRRNRHHLGRDGGYGRGDNCRGSLYGGNHSARDTVFSGEPCQQADRAAAHVDPLEHFGDGFLCLLPFIGRLGIQHLSRSMKADGVGGKRDLFVSQFGIGIDPDREGILL